MKRWVGADEGRRQAGESSALKGKGRGEFTSLLILNLLSPGFPISANGSPSTQLEEGMATHSSILACRIPWTEKLGGLQSLGLQRVGYD